MRLNEKLFISQEQGLCQFLFTIVLPLLNNYLKDQWVLYGEVSQRIYKGD